MLEGCRRLEPPLPSCRLPGTSRRAASRRHGFPYRFPGTSPLVTWPPGRRLWPQRPSAWILSHGEACRGLQQLLNPQPSVPQLTTPADAFFCSFCPFFPFHFSPRFSPREGNKVSAQLVGTDPAPAASPSKGEAFQCVRGGKQHWFKTTSCSTAESPPSHPSHLQEVLENKSLQASKSPIKIYIYSLNTPDSQANLIFFSALSSAEACTTLLNDFFFSFFPNSLESILLLHIFAFISTSAWTEAPLMKIFFPECGVGNPEHFLLLETEPVEWGKAPCSRTPGSTLHFYFFVQNYQSSKTSDFSALTSDFAWKKNCLVKQQETSPSPITPEKFLKRSNSFICTSPKSDDTRKQRDQG